MSYQSRLITADIRANGDGIDFKRTLWAAADKLRSNLDAAEYKHVVLGLIFLKYISDAFNVRYQELEEEAKNLYDNPDDREALLEDKDEYLAENVFWVPKEARWSHLQANAKQPTIGKLLDDAMIAIERDNPKLKGVLPKNYARPALDKQRLGELVDLISTIGLGDKASQKKDILGRVYEYFLQEFASAEGKKGGQFYTPRSVVQLLVEMLAPYKGRVYDPCCGSGGMFVQSEKFVEAHGGRVNDISVYGQESNPTTWRLANMNLAIRGIDGNLGSEHADTFHRDLHPDLKADYIIANPPFNMSDWGGSSLKDDARWKFGVPPNAHANYAWIQHFISHLAPNGFAGFVLANGCLTSNQSGEGEIRQNLIEADLIDCIVALPSQLFYSTPIPVSLWFIARNKDGGKFRKRLKEVLFINAHSLGNMISRTQRELFEEDIKTVSQIYRSWLGNTNREYKDIGGTCKAVTLDEIRSHKYALVPGRYVGFSKGVKENWDLQALRDEFDEIESRISKISTVSRVSLAMLREFVDG